MTKVKGVEAAQALSLFTSQKVLSGNLDAEVELNGPGLGKVDLVKSLIRLSGHKEEDIEVKFVGMRPGEKMFEEILIDEEKTRSTKFEKIFIAPPVDLQNGKTVAGVDAVLKAAADGDGGTVIKSLFDMGIGFSSEVHR